MFEFCSGLVDLVVCVGRHGGGGHGLTLAGELFVGRSPRTSRRWAIAAVNSGNRPVMAPTANPAMVAAGSQRPSRSKRAARTARGLGRCGVARVMVVSYRDGEVLECGQRVIVFGLEPDRMTAEMGLDESDIAFLRDH